MSRLIAVSNRVPLPKKNSSSPGGLAIGLLGALKKNGGVWFGWSGKVSGERHSETITDANVDYKTIDLNQQEYDQYYNGFSNGMLWPLCHFVLGFVKYNREEYEGYVGVNQRFAEHLNEEIRQGDVVWVHDYHLIPLGKMIRDKHPGTGLGFFLHVPFPAWGMLQSLPVAKQLLTFLSHYDVVGFQTQDDREAFQMACIKGIGAKFLSKDKLQVGNRIVTTKVCPIGVDCEAIKTEADENELCFEYGANSQANHKAFVGADRIDYSKGLVERFKAFDNLFERFPQHIERTTMFQVATVSRGDDPNYAELRESLDKRVARTNGKYGKLGWMPIHYLNCSLSHGELMAFFRHGDVCAVTSLRDGMNLVAKEFIAAQNPSNPGVLILSELAGAAKELDSALIINPYDVEGIADAMQSALTMRIEERRERYVDMMRVVRENDIHRWRDSFIQALHNSVPHQEVEPIYAAVS